MSCQHKAVFFF
jgi:hypothetical protein